LAEIAKARESAIAVSINFANELMGALEKAKEEEEKELEKEDEKDE
jgi:hypothetical protein